MDIKKTNAKRALYLTTILTLFAAGFELFIAFENYKPGMNFFDVASYVTANRYIYYLLLILVNMIMLPSVVLLFKENEISLKDEIYKRETLKKDIGAGVIALALTGIVTLIFSFFYRFQSDMAYSAVKPTTGLTILGIISLGLVSGTVKEIFFRGFAKVFVGPVMGQMTALILFNLLFAMLDWYNFGLSFAIGLIWIFAYKKSGHLISTMIAHGGINIIALIYLIITGI